VNPHPDCLGEITLEYPFLQERYEMFRDRLMETDRGQRRSIAAASQMALFREAEKTPTN
jgi:hypothetical protein